MWSGGLGEQGRCQTRTHSSLSTPPFVIVVPRVVRWYPGEERMGVELSD